MAEPISFLSNVRVASPCFQSWEMMEGNDHSRFCKECKHDVFNLSEMTKDEAEALLSSHTGRLCIRYYQRRDGTVMTKDCPVGASAVHAEKWRKRRAFIAVAGTLGLMGSATVADLFKALTVVETTSSSDNEIVGKMVNHESSAEPPKDALLTTRVPPVMGSVAEWNPKPK